MALSGRKSPVSQGYSLWKPLWEKFPISLIMLATNNVLI
ncbi:hypothetical protein MYAER_0428 [Microcystis aeruginosa NIES-2549]|uniref:Uncharacterized protein n=1 Tax=Microcystis aeruginosa NIES-2549 TaxID=1641812 RepID=A0A0F6RJC0_MICAE|nr:hypothetical protein MYAER_0428 [Microcystis aeruginosa NIES-2549]AOC51181.1 hypothetical protein amyaer_0430 [Microcystis aeruginosa NIES-2481]